MIEPKPGARADTDPLVSMARSTCLTRKMRNELFGGALFGEPAWDILLVLFATDRDHGPYALDALAAEIEESVDVTRRWVGIVGEQGLVHFDGLHVELSARGAQALRQYFKRQIGALMEMLAAFRGN
jgi:hypothetical protein